MKALIVSDRAQRDIEQIGDFTKGEWGEKAWRRYKDLLMRRMSALRARPSAGRARDDLKAGYRSLLCGSHVIFFRETDSSVEVVRVLHQRMDIRSRLADEG
jgi:toxin ParE1/3/4